MITPFKTESLNIKEASLKAKQERLRSQPPFPMDHFIRATEDYTTIDHFVPAPYFRRGFMVKKGICSAVMLVCGLGICETYLNGKNISRGRLAPYRARPDHLVYFDRLDMTSQLLSGKNVLGFWLGCGLQSGVHRKYGWRELPWRGAVQLAFRLELNYADGTQEILYSDEHTKTADSPLLFNDYHYGEYYDAQLELPGWNEIGFDDSQWRKALPAPKPMGEPRICEAEPIRCFEEMKPVSVTPVGDGYVYDFGVNHAGLCRLKIRGKRGQKLLMKHFERLLDGVPYFDRIMAPDLRSQEDEYTCRGGETEIWMPQFTYHGFRYVWIFGITPEQATPELLTYVVMHSDLRPLGSFSCDNEMINALEAATVRSDLSNFFYFPTDCPHREKHGWTADAALSADQLFHHYDAGVSYREWLRSVHYSMKPDGTLPGVIPTGGRFYDWCNGPAWDQALVELPYQTYRFTGDTQILREASTPFMRYLTHLHTKRNEMGLIGYGLGDWCDVDAPEMFCNTPQLFTDSVIAMDIAAKCRHLFRVIGQKDHADFAGALADSLLQCIRRELIDHERLLAYGETQTTQAMALYYGIFTPEEEGRAFQNLLSMIHEKNDHFATGVLGGRVLFRVLAERGQAELALRMITRTDAPSYGNVIARGGTTLWEEFNEVFPTRGDENHHFWGDISAWFFRYPGGLRINPDCDDVNRVDVAPCFLGSVGKVNVSHQFPGGGLEVQWRREGDGIKLILTAAPELHGKILLPDGWHFEDGTTEKALCSGIFILS